MAVIPLTGDRLPYAAPVPIERTHKLDAFDCGKPALDEWLRAHALDNEGKASRTYVIATDAGDVAAFYSLATGSVIRTEVPRKYRHGLPNPVPVMILGRLAVSRDHAGKGLGPAMLFEALQRTVEVAEIAGVFALIVHAIDDDAVSFYARYGFQLFPPETRTLLMPIETARAAVASD